MAMCPLVRWLQEQSGGQGGRMAWRRVCAQMMRRGWQQRLSFEFQAS